MKKKPKKKKPMKMISMAKGAYELLEDASNVYYYSTGDRYGASELFRYGMKLIIKEHDSAKVRRLIKNEKADL